MDKDMNTAILKHKIMCQRYILASQLIAGWLQSANSVPPSSIAHIQEILNLIINGKEIFVLLFLILDKSLILFN
jgi:uncharacterized membrane protein